MAIANDKASAHTPAPWNLDKRILEESASEDHHGLRVLHAGGRDIAYCLITSENADAPSQEDKDVCEANARLMAQAPRLLQGLKEAVKILAADPDNDEMVREWIGTISMAQGKTYPSA